MKKRPTSPLKKIRTMIGSKATPSATVKRSGVYHSNDNQCSEITSTLGRCQNTVTTGTTFCHLHQRKKLEHEDKIFDSTFAHVAHGIWIGSLDTANDPEALKAAGIKSIVNISGWEPRSKTRAMYKKLGISYHTLTTRDRVTGKLRYLGDEPIGPRLSLGEFYRYMDRGVDMMKNTAKPILVNCFAGINRSASLVAAYLIAVYKMPFSHARHYLIEANKKRSIDVLTNRDFVSAMSRYGEHLQRNRTRN
jgi:hypothetical protein